MVDQRIPSPLHPPRERMSTVADEPSDTAAAADALAQLMPWLMRFVNRGPWAARLTLQQLRVLFAIGGEEGRSGEIAADVGLKPSTMTGTINALHGHGLVTRRRDPLARRVVLIGLTPAGRALYRGVTLASDRRCRQLVQALRPLGQRAA